LGWVLWLESLKPLDLYPTVSSGWAGGDQLWFKKGADSLGMPWGCLRPQRKTARSRDRLMLDEGLHHKTLLGLLAHQPRPGIL